MKSDELNDMLHKIKIDVDTDALWDSVSEHLPTEKKRRWLPLFFWGTGVLAMLTIGYFLLITPSTIVSETTSGFEPEMNIANEQERANELAEVSSEALRGASIMENQISEVSSNPISVNTSGETESIVEARSSSSTFQKVSKDYKLSNNQTGLNYSNRSVEGNNPISIEEDPSMILYASDPTEISDIVDHKNRVINIETLDQLLAQPLLFNKQREEVEGYVEPLKVNKPKPDLWSLGAYTQAALTNSSYTILATEGVYSLISSFEQMMPTVGGQLDVGCKITPRLQAVAGIAWTRHTSRIDLQLTSFESITEQALVRQIIQEDGSVIDVTGPVTTEYTTITDVRYHNYHNLIQLPLALNWIVLDHEKWQGYVAGGVSLNLMNMGRGISIDNENRIIQYTNKSNPYNYSNWNPRLGLGMRYSYGNGMLDLNLQWVRNRIGLNQSYVKELNNLGLSVGYRYNLN